MIDIDGLCCPICGTQLHQMQLDVGVFFDLLIEEDVLCHYVCAEYLGGMRLKDRVRHRKDMKWDSAGHLIVR